MEDNSPGSLVLCLIPTVSDEVQRSHVTLLRPPAGEWQGWQPGSGASLPSASCSRSLVSEWLQVSSGETERGAGEEVLGGSPPLYFQKDQWGMHLP